MRRPWTLPQPRLNMPALRLGVARVLHRWWRGRSPVYDMPVVGDEDRQAEPRQAFDFATDALLEALADGFKAFFQELLVDLPTVHGLFARESGDA